MKYRTLGKTQMRVSVVGVGTWQFGGEWGKDFTQEEVDAMFAAAAECGINLIDTAECYGDHLSEQFIGRAIEGRRDQWIIATKFGHKFTEPFAGEDRFAPAQVQQQLEDSLRALRTDYVDLYQMHSGRNRDFQTEGLWEMLNRQVEAGKIRHLGISLGGNNIFQTDQAGEVNAETIQVIYNRIQRGAEEEVLPACIRQDLGVLARVPLASGFLSGKYDLRSQFGDNDTRERDMDTETRRKQIADALAVRDEVPAGVPMAQWALGWCLQHPAVSCVIPGCKSVEQVVSNAAAADLDMVRADHPQAAE